MAIPTPYSTKMNLSYLCLQSPHRLQQRQQPDQERHRCDNGDQAAHNGNDSSTPFQLHPQQPPLHHPSHFQKQSQQHSNPLQQTNVHHQHQQQQQQQRPRKYQDYRSNSRASDRFATTTPISSTSSDDCSDWGSMDSSSVGSESSARSKNADQMAKKRSGLVDNDTETPTEFSQLFISPTSSAINTSPTTSAPTTTATAAVAAAGATTRTVLGDCNQDDIHDYYYYYPQGWTAALISSGVGGSGRVVPFRRINNSGYHHSIIHPLHSPFVLMDPKPYPHQSAFPPDAQHLDSVTLHQRPIPRGLPAASPGHHSHSHSHPHNHSHSQHYYPSSTPPVAKDLSSLPPSSPPFRNSHRQPQQSFWPPRSHQQQEIYPHYQREHSQHSGHHQWHQGQDHQGGPHPPTEQHHDRRMEKDDSNSNNDKSNSNANSKNDNDHPPHPPSSTRLSVSSPYSAIDVDPQTQQKGQSADPRISSVSGPMGAIPSPMPVAGSGSGSGPPQSSSSSRGTVFDRGGYVDEAMHEFDRRSYPPHLPPHSPYPHPHPARHPPAYPYSPASPTPFSHSERERDFDMDTTSSLSSRGAIEPARPMSNLNYQHRQLQQQQQQQQYRQASPTRRQGEGQSPPISPPEDEASGSRSTRFSFSSIDGNNRHTHPSYSHRHRESSLSSAKATVEGAFSIGNRDLDSPHPQAETAAASSSITQTTAATTTTTSQVAPVASATASISTTTINNNPLDDPSPSSRLPHARRDWNYDLVPRASFHPLDNPRDSHPYVRAHSYQPLHDAHRRHSAQPPSHAHPYPCEYPYVPHRPHPLNRSGSFDEGHPEYHYPRTHWNPYGPQPPSHYPPHLPPPPPSHLSAYYVAPPRPPPPPHGPATSSSSRRSIDNNSNRRNGQYGDGGMSNYGSYAEDGEGETEGGKQKHRGGNQSSSRFNNLRFKFGTDMPSTIDLKSAIESCDILCRFALHYGNQIKNSDSTSHETVEGSALGLDPIERANLQKIRSMNTTMLIGIQKEEKANDPSSSSFTAAAAAGGGPSGEILDADRMMKKEEEIELNELEGSPLRFGPGQPWNVMVLELARASTSIFQLAIRIKAWVNMTPAERELDEEINMIRGKRCLLMDSTLSVPTVDQHGNLQKDWAVVPAATSTSKSFYQRQRDLEHQRQTHTSVLPKQTKSGQQAQVQSTAVKHELGTSLESNGMMMDHDGAPETNAFKIPRRNSSNGGVSSTAASRLDSLKRSSGLVSLVGGGGAGNSESTMDSSMSSSFTSNDNRATSSMNDGANAYRSADGATRNSKNSDVPHQKYRKRAKRSQAPGRCQSCHSSDTPEWRRGPDGARTLCNACGLHYAKLLRRQNERAQQSPSRISIALPSSTASTTTTNGSSNINGTATTTAAAPSTPSTTLALPAPTPVVTPTPTAPSVPTAAPAETVSASKSTSQPSSRKDTGFPVISFPFKRLHGQGRANASSPSATSTATATTATSTATVMTSSGPGLLSFSSSSSTLSSGRRTLTDHQVVPMFDGQSSGSGGSGADARAPVGSRGGSSTNTSQYQMLHRQQQQYQQMEYQKPQPNLNQNQQAHMRDVNMDESPRTKSEH